jgi:hypothetical protein
MCSYKNQLQQSNFSNTNLRRQGAHQYKLLCDLEPVEMRLCESWSPLANTIRVLEAHRNAFGDGTQQLVLVRPLPPTVPKKEKFDTA